MLSKKFDSWEGKTWDEMNDIIEKEGADGVSVDNLFRYIDEAPYYLEDDPAVIEAMRVLDRYYGISSMSNGVASLADLHDARRKEEESWERIPREWRKRPL